VEAVLSCFSKCPRSYKQFIKSSHAEESGKKRAAEIVFADARTIESSQEEEYPRPLAPLIIIREDIRAHAHGACTK